MNNLSTRRPACDVKGAATRHAMTKKTQLRAARAQCIARQHYEPGNQSRCLKTVWRCYVEPELGVGYRTFLNYMKTDISDLPARSVALIDHL